VCHPAAERAECFPCPDDCARCGTTQQQNTHIRTLRAICYPWHPWHGRTVWVRAELVRHGQAVAYCSLEDVQTCRVLEVPLWMLELATCSRTRISKPGFASAQSLRELKEILQSAQQRLQSESREETQHRYLLKAGGADGGIPGPAEIEPTPVVCSSTTQPQLDGSVVRSSTKDSAIGRAVTEAPSRSNRRRGTPGGGAR
jgi:hypothetical protein